MTSTVVPDLELLSAKGAKQRGRRSPGRSLMFKDACGVLLAPDQRRYPITLVALFSSLAIIEVLLPGERLGWFMAGAFVVSVPWTLLVMVMLVRPDFGPRMRGVMTETDAIKQLRKATTALTVIPNVRFERFDVDAVIVTPQAVLACEVKWHGAKAKRDVIEGSADLARRRARALQALLHQHGVDKSVVVRPVLCLAGPATLLLRESAMSWDGVVIVDHEHIKTWIEAQRTGMVSRDLSLQIERVLRSHEDSRRQA